MSNGRRNIHPFYEFDVENARPRTAPSPSDRVIPGGSMDVLVMLEEPVEYSPVLAHVNSVPSARDSERSSREVVTLYGTPSPEVVALALAAAVECRRTPRDPAEMMRHLGVWAERGAIGDAAWRDVDTGELVTRDLEIPLEILRETSLQLLTQSGQLIRRLIAGLLTPDWPEGARRAINITLEPVVALTGAATAKLEAMLETLREADALAYDYEGD
ncbi:MAG: hypothetical protein NVS4B3_07970 [Gemmatimonadaceae bacterium]